MKKLIILIAMVGSSLVANAIEFRQRTEVVASSTPTLPECNIVYKVTERADPFTPGGWVTVNVEVIQNTCNEAQ